MKEGLGEDETWRKGDLVKGRLGEKGTGGLGDCVRKGLGENGTDVRCGIYNLIWI